MASVETDPSPQGLLMFACLLVRSCSVLDGWVPWLWAAWELLLWGCHLGCGTVFLTTRNGCGLRGLSLSLSDLKDDLLVCCWYHIQILTSFNCPLIALFFSPTLWGITCFTVWSSQSPCSFQGQISPVIEACSDPEGLSAASCPDSLWSSFSWSMLCLLPLEPSITTLLVTVRL